MRTGGCAWTNYPFLTRKERDNETGLDYFLARYYSSTQGRFTSPDEFTGGPDELYYFVDDAADNPTFYADLRNPQSLNKYQYTYNNPLNLTDNDGHCPECAEAIRPIVPVIPFIPGVREAAVITSVVVILAKAIDSIPGDRTAGDGSCPSCDANIRNYQRKAQEKFDAQGSENPKEVTIDGSKHPEAAQNATDAQKAGQPDTLTVDRAGAKNRRREALSGTKPKPGKDRDEYPPAVTKEGGRGASVRPISPRDNRGAGASIGNQIKKVPDGGKIKIKVIKIEIF